MLSAEAERALCYRWRDHHDISAAQQLVGSRLRLVARIAKVYHGYGLPLEDLIGEGHVGMMRALCRFDPDRDVRFATSRSGGYALRSRSTSCTNWSMVKIGTITWQKKLLTANFAPVTSSGRRRAVIDTKVSAIPSHNGRVISSLSPPLRLIAMLSRIMESCNQARGSNCNLEETHTGRRSGVGVEREY